jgi:hypothetical protein
MINITDGIQPDVAEITNSMVLPNSLDMNLKMAHSDLKINLKKDFAERTIFMQATTRGDNQVKKEIFLGVKKACNFNLPTSYEFVFDHGYAGDTYGVEDLIQVFSATTNNKAEGSTH